MEKKLVYKSGTQKIPGWHEDEPGWLLEYPALRNTGIVRLFYDKARRRQRGNVFHTEFKLFKRRRSA